jgi:hypothetical protein
VTLSETIAFLDKVSSEQGFEYTKRISTHIGRVANVPVRNVGLTVICFLANSHIVA